MEHNTWSFNFKDCSVSDALNRIAEITGIDIFTDKPINKKLCKFYDAGTIDQILKDIFRKDNHAIVWYYSEQALDSIGIWVFEGGSSKGNFNPEKFLQDRKRNLKGTTTKRSVDYNTANAKKYSWKTENNTSVIQEKSKKYDNSHHSKSITNRKQTVSHNSVDNIPNSKDELTARPPLPPNKHGLEPPPMPPGFSGKN